MVPLKEHALSCRSANGALVAKVFLVPEKDPESPNSAPLVQEEDGVAKEYGETSVQLREQCAYEYEVEPVAKGSDLRLRCSLASRYRKRGKSPGDSGRLVTGNYSGALLLEIVEGEIDHTKPPVASALIDVRSIKLDYRTEYRGMLRFISKKLAGLVADARSSTKLGFHSSWQDRQEKGWLQIQLELLRETLDSAEFAAAMQRILSFPHERLTSEPDLIPTDKPFRWSPPVIRQIAIGQPRRVVPELHQLRLSHGLATIPERVCVLRKTRNLDTQENRFIKHALLEFHAFLSHCQRVFSANNDWQATAALARRLSANLEDWLGRSFFKEVGQMRFAPLGSPVLQRKAGYREILLFWLRFRTSAEISWKGGEEVFHAGQRNVADLYEYWLFFQLLDWFCDTLGQSAPPLEQLLDGLDGDSPNLRLRKQTHLGPFAGQFGDALRPLAARFDYNRSFAVTADRAEEGSWSRKMHPDYTLTFWPQGLTEEEAARQELLVHVHFDAKYRVEDYERLFGSEGEEADEEDAEDSGNYKRQDLLKMHAYRDAIKRSQGAYVLYPGDPRSRKSQHKDGATEASARWPHTMWGFHEILPGIGAFAVAPDAEGKPQGLSELKKFLSEILAHLGNRTTARERVTYHIAEAYSVKEQPVPYGRLPLPETDIYGAGYRALPPAEDMVLAVWCQNETQRTLAEDVNGFAFTRMVHTGSALYAHPNLARVRHVAFRSNAGVVGPGLLELRETGFLVFTRSQLRTELQQHAKANGVAVWEAVAGADDDEQIYALFRTRKDPVYGAQEWDGNKVMDLVEAFETDARNKLVNDVVLTPQYPRMLTLRDFLTTMV